MTVITWKTHKGTAGYEWTVYSFGYQIPAVTLKSGVCKTRPQATGQAQRWCAYLKAQAKRGIAA
jgi:hypothetical protein